MMELSQIVSRMPMSEYRAIDALNISRLKELQRSPLHYVHRLGHPLVTAPLTLGTAAHCATLEPERFNRQFAVWDRRTDSGRMAPRNGKWWDAFQAANDTRTILTGDERDEAISIATAVRADPVAMRYLESGEPEVSMTWEPGRKGRVDWLTFIAGKPVLVGLKTARDCRHFSFGSAAAKLGYPLQWAWYQDGYKAIRGTVPTVIEIVVESAPPHAVAVYRIVDDILAYGREQYEELLDQLAECERRKEWPGPYTEEQVLTLPSWVYGPASDDLAELELER
jgi:PDDEXK-like domain of unknown function (DUF3799)